MTTTRPLFFSLLILSLVTACSSSDAEVGSDNGTNIEDSSSRIESDPNDDGKVTYEEQSAQGSLTTNTTNYAERADSFRIARDTLVKPRYTDNEYEAAFSTSTTNPRNQVEGGITPGDEQKRREQ